MNPGPIVGHVTVHEDGTVMWMANRITAAGLAELLASAAISISEHPATVTEGRCQFGIDAAHRCRLRSTGEVAGVAVCDRHLALHTDATAERVARDFADRNGIEL